jgi:uncharacterized protein Yka (UPF0111/DUF47 family)
MMLKKEREVAYLIEKFLDNIMDWQKTASGAVLSYLMDDKERLKLAVLSKNQFQTIAEKDRQHIWQKLCEGAYLPVIRGSLFSITTDASKIAQSATICCETFYFQQPQVSQKLATEFSSTTQGTFNLFKPVYDSILQYLRGIDVVKTIRRNTELFSNLKTEVILLEDELKHQISASSFDPWQKTQLNTCAQSITAVSNQISEMEDEIQLIIARLVS